jgi:hypothetical protein
MAADNDSCVTAGWQAGEVSVFLGLDLGGDRDFLALVFSRELELHFASFCASGLTAPFATVTA